MKRNKSKKRDEICTTKDLSEDFKEFKLVRLIFPDDRILTRSFNDRASHINKTDKFNNNTNMPASHNHSSSETTIGQMINGLDNSSENNASFPNPLMSVNNVYNFDAHPWPKNNILIAGDSMINEINEKRISTNFKSVKVRGVSGAMIDHMYFNFIPLLRKKTSCFSFTCGYQQFVKSNIISDL